MNTFPVSVSRIVRSTIVLPEPGRIAWISRMQPRSLPEGLLNRTRVEILAIGPRVCAVKSLSDLKEWIVERVHIDAGSRYDLHGNGSKAPEHHPAVQAYLLEEIEHLRSRPRPVPQIDDQRLIQISEYIWILTRHGREVPPATDPDQRQKEETFFANTLADCAIEPVSIGYDPAKDIDDSPP